MDSPQNNAPRQNEDVLNIKDIALECLRKWYLFAISIIICVGAGAYKALSTKPVYVRSATVLIKETNARRVSTNDIENMFSMSGQMSSRVANEVVAFQSPSLMSEVVKRLGLQTEYAMKGRFHDKVVYGSQVPVSVCFDSLCADRPVVFDLLPCGDSSFTVSKLQCSVDGAVTKPLEPFEVRAGEQFDTPLGPVVVTFNDYCTVNKPWVKPLHVVRRPLEVATRRFLGGFKASTEASSSSSKIRPSDIITLTDQDYNYSRASDLLNMIIVVYNENWVEDNNRTAISTSNFIKERLAALEQELNKVDAQISGYKGENLIPDAKSASSMAMTARADLAKQLQELESQLSVIKYMRSTLTSSLNSYQLIPTPSIIGNPGLVSQINEYNNKVLMRDNLVANSSERNRLVKDLNEVLNSMREAIKGSIDNQISTVEQQIRHVEEDIEKNSAALASAPGRAKDLVALERNQKVQEQLYLLLLQKKEENELTQAFTAYNTRIITPPYGSNAPTEPHKAKIVLIAFIIGLCIPAAYIYLSRVLNNTVKGRQDIATLSAPFLGEIPKALETESRSVKLRRKLRKLRKVEDPVTERIVVKNGCRDVINEAFRVLRTNYEFIDKGGASKVNILASFNPGSGKTFVTLNLGTAMALKKRRVLVIDGDFRKASLGRHFGLSKKAGIADYLAGRTQDIDSLIVQPDPSVSLFVLPVGTIPPNPSELVSEPALDELVNRFRAEYDAIFIDCAPVDIVSDTQIIARVADRTLFVVRSGMCEKSMLPQIDRMATEGIYPSLAVILNGTEMSGGRYSYSYGRYGYKSYTGYGYGQKKA